MDADAPYRNIPESSILGMLLLLGWRYEAESRAARNEAREALESWIQCGLKFRQTTNGLRLFDPVEVINFSKQAKLDPSFSQRIIGLNRRIVLETADVAAHNEQGCRFVVDYQRTFHLRSIPPGTSLRLRAPLPLTGDYLRDLQVTPFIKGTDEAQIKINPGRLEARLTTTGEPEVTLGATLRFTAQRLEPRPGKGHVLTDADRALYLREEEDLIVVSERVRSLAKSLAAVKMPALEAVRQFWQHIHAKLKIGGIYYDQIDHAAPCDWILDRGLYDCQWGAILLVALCRAYGIPARLIGGFLLYRVVPGIHYWAEAWIEDQGWTPFDFFSLSLSGDGNGTEWRDRFFGRLDYRMACERLPKEFTGTIGIPVPEKWFLLQQPLPGALEISFLSRDGTPVYIDTLRVVSGDESPSGGPNGAKLDTTGQRPGKNGSNG